MRPLDPLRSIKTKLGVVIVAAVGVTVVVVALGASAGIPLWLIGVVAAAGALAMVQFLAHGMTSPLREMAAAARAMATGDYERRVTASSRDEVGELARAFNRMATDLAEVDRHRRDLIADVSHELRTPITALQAVLENLVDGVEQPDHAVLTSVLDQVQTLGHLVAQLLDLSRLESGAEKLRTEALELRPVLQQNIDQAARVGSRVNMTLSVQPPDLRVTADRVKLGQVVANLLDNAIRHSPDEGRVSVVATRGATDSGDVCIEVTDEGAGIPEAERERVFERFYRSPDARRTSDGGSGLGLSIARWIVQLHGGEIRAAADTNGGRGCRMIVTLPAP
ncbi:MAG TPA: ATP-binding protein [Actinomycetota bacterium]|nr:ATP-binding protein [Actinomycetota bacterium]